MQLRIVVLLAAMAWPSVGSEHPARGAPMSRGSRVGYGREIGPRCRGPKSPANVELLQVIKGPLGQPGGPSTIFGSTNLAPFANSIFSHKRLHFELPPGGLCKEFGIPQGLCEHLR